MDRLDVLNRDAFVKELVCLMENISENKSSTCFAIDGRWGCGKSFILDMFEEQLSLIQSEETYTDKYFIIRYNSWKFDYYEEPLVAIVATMISEIEKKTKLFPDSQEKCEILGMLKAAGVSLLSLANAALKEKTGLDIQMAYETISKGEKDAAAAYESKHDYDVYFSFNKVMGELTDLLQSLAKSYTIVIMVDELDRCLPEYAVKVLERLHHLTESSSNIITLIAIDKKQLVSSIKQIFGFDEPEKYLEKFFQFEVKLDCGIVSKRISEKHAEYFDLFDKELFAFEDSVEECLQLIFRGIDIRSQEQLIKKAMLAHKMLFGVKKDYSFMCMELLITVMICVYQDNSCFYDQQVQGRSIVEMFTLSRNNDPPFALPFKEKIEKVGFTERHFFPDDPLCYVLPDKPSLYGAIVFSWYWMHQEKRSYSIGRPKGHSYDPILKNHEELKKFAETINIIK